MLNYTVTEVQKILRAPPLRARKPSPARLGAGMLSGGRPTKAHRDLPVVAVAAILKRLPHHPRPV
jgi:hypothetical protein